LFFAGKSNCTLTVSRERKAQLAEDVSEADSATGDDGMLI